MTVLKFTSKQDYLAYVEAEKAQSKPVSSVIPQAATPQPKATAAPIIVTPQPKITAPQAAAQKITPKKTENVMCRKCKRFSSEHCTYGNWRVISPDRVRNCEHYE